MRADLPSVAVTSLRHQYGRQAVLGIERRALARERGTNAGATLDAASTRRNCGLPTHFDRAFAAAYQWLLWAAAYIIEGGCSDDGFMDFRYGLISRGRSVFERALADPDSLADVADDTTDGFIPNEDFGYVAQRVYQK